MTTKKQFPQAIDQLDETIEQLETRLAALKAARDAEQFQAVAADAQRQGLRTEVLHPHADRTGAMPALAIHH